MVRVRVRVRVKVRVRARLEVTALPTGCVAWFGSELGFGAGSDQGQWSGLGSVVRVRVRARARVRVGGQRSGQITEQADHVAGRTGCVNDVRVRARLGLGRGWR